ncbi:hypothetical protein CLIB1423_03S02212 [[Candida] railenensis]|uniref:U1 small nuclear ribonucleoprotein component SNU71 n=1 Tax=[Candida] railenensis TaxID=45579 RepID=A0A9P0VWV2_9ASCO|nr:hypothetical protein CLIB1423_03S02212 [[Candida] railenensis]
MSFKINQVDQDHIDRKLQKDSKSKKFPKIFKTKVNVSKVNMKVIKNWISEEIDSILKDDDIVVDYLYELLIVEEEPNIKQIHLQMIDFLGEEEALKFCSKLWGLLISGSQDEDGIPKELIEEKRKQMMKGRGRDREIEKGRNLPVEKAVTPAVVAPTKTNYNRSSYNASNRTKSPERRRGVTNYRERDYRENF